jgi:hypothetical protein
MDLERYSTKIKTRNVQTQITTRMVPRMNETIINSNKNTKLSASDSNRKDNSTKSCISFFNSDSKKDDNTTNKDLIPLPSNRSVSLSCLNNTERPVKITIRAMSNKNNISSTIVKVNKKISTKKENS